MDTQGELKRLEAALKLAKKRNMNVVGLLCSSKNDLAFYPSEYLANKTNVNGHECNAIAEHEMKRFLRITDTEINIIER